MHEPGLDPFNFHFDGQVAVITGGARGLGFQFARALAQRGAIVCLADIDAEAGQSAEHALRAEGLAQSHFVALDVTQADQHEAVAQSVIGRFRRLDLWINNAGIARHGPSATYDPAVWRLSLDIMLSGAFYGAQAAGRRMIDQGGGTIINIASVNGMVAQAGRAAYCAAKAGVIRLTEVLAAEWAANNVRVNAIAPAVFLTDLARGSIADGSSSLDVYIQRSPTGRLGELEELVGTILFLASEHASEITGQTLRVDGGWTADQYL
jgi:NAD(P)-dependent dehydrogenase (short-subunit alcohol dehydrogenase family)